jgi:hypothetical protein
MEKVYDHIIIGASIPGVIFALAQAEAGKTVLLSNMFGFPGGSITEQLNCLQVADRSALSGTSIALFDAVTKDNFGASIVNPETVKYTLQQYMERSSVSLLFHVTPVRIVPTDNGTVDVTMLAKEGTITVSGRHVTDATEDYSAAVLFGRKRTVAERSIHLFISAPADEQFLSFEKIRKAVKLADGRYWITLAIASQDELFAENESHETLDSFRSVLDRSGSRIQVLPLGIHTQYRLAPSGAVNAFFSVLHEMNGQQSVSSEQFLTAARLSLRNN